MLIYLRGYDNTRRKNVSKINEDVLSQYNSELFFLKLKPCSKKTLTKIYLHGALFTPIEE